MRSNSRRARAGRTTHYALGLARWFAGNVPAALEALETGCTLNPNDTTILADLGQRYAMLAHWDDAMPLLEESYAANPAQPGSYRIGLFLWHFAHGRFIEALAEARRTNAPHILNDEAADAVAAIRGIDPDYDARAAIDLAKRHVAPDLALALLAGLRRAGLAIPPDALS